MSEKKVSVCGHFRRNRASQESLVKTRSGKLTDHVCCPKCVTKEKSIKNPRRYQTFADCLLMADISPFEVPMTVGWKRNKTRGSVFYVTPCHKRCWTIKEVDDYLKATDSNFSIDQFDFSFNLSFCMVIPKAKPIKTIPDVSNGNEKIPIPLVNEIDEAKLSKFTYSNERIAVGFKFDNDCKTWCECDGDCQSDCPCIQLTLEESKLIKVSSSIMKRNIGYKYKRLPFLSPTGVYECNARCSCSAKCSNRVVQHGLKMRFQVFKTPDKGWGLRCLHDIPKGTFVCTYSGEVYSDGKLEAIAKKRGDEYVAALDYIEEFEKCVETIMNNNAKEGYESDVESYSTSDTTSGSGNSDSVVFSDSSLSGHSDVDDKFLKHSSKVESVEIDDEPLSKKKRMEERDDFMSLTDYFGEEAYLIDAKAKGNIGRFLNHSCDPNCKLQPIFIENHDPRFPIVAFFTIKEVKALTELTWDYNYRCLPNRKNTCKCGSKKCRNVYIA